MRRWRLLRGLSRRWSEWLHRIEDLPIDTDRQVFFV
jgi:hypothetical protein